MELRLLSSLEKVFMDAAPVEQGVSLQVFRNETQSFQLAFCQPGREWQEVSLAVEGPDHLRWRVRQVGQVPVRMARYDDGDADTLRGGEPGLYPDLLTDVQPHTLRAGPHWSSLWVDVWAAEGAEAGSGMLWLCFVAADGTPLGERAVSVEILPGQLPEQKLLLTRWFHCDGLAQHYGVEPFSEAHWMLIEKQLRLAVQRGMNMVLTPIHTPPLDTAVGHERMTVQLVDVIRENGAYRFGMDKLRRWIHMCRDCGIAWFEMAHLYTQWGAQHAPKIAAWENGVCQRIFGWETDARSAEYRAFLTCYIPAVRQVFREEGLEAQMVWHISDEPSSAHLAGYLAARKQLDDVLAGCTVMDALSNFAFYQQGIVERPVVATNHAEPFLQAGVPDLWVYYCCAQYRDVANMFIAMPSSRSRILGAQLFRIGAAGFLHWGFNFYNCMGSWYPVNPYQSTDADCGVPAGDPFQVYPGADGEPEESMRLMVAFHALEDLRALEYLAGLTSREYVNTLLDDTFGGELTLHTVAEGRTLLELRRRVNEEICCCLAR